MLKLYKSNFTKDELLTMAVHASYFCPLGSDIHNSCSSDCGHYRVCRDFHNLADYCLQKVKKQGIQRLLNI